MIRVIVYTPISLDVHDLFETLCGWLIWYVCLCADVLWLLWLLCKTDLVWHTPAFIRRHTYTSHWLSVIRLVQIWLFCWFYQCKCHFNLRVQWNVCLILILVLNDDKFRIRFNKTNRCVYDINIKHITERQTK